MRRHPNHKNRWILSRREFLSPLALAPLWWWPAALRSSGVAQSKDSAIRGPEFSSLEAPVTPNDQFFLRDHFAAPRLSQQDWMLLVAGHVRSPFEIGYRDMLSLPSRTITDTLECAGNGVGGGGVGTATWTGVSLQALLQKAGLGPGVKQIRLIGADRGREGASPTLLPFFRSIPLEKALDPDTLVAFQMNGAPLPAEHGYPARAIVPGWYGMDSVKWLIRIEALEREDTGFFMTRSYIRVRLGAIGSEQAPLTQMRVKSQIARPREGEVLAAGLYTVRGAAWAGENKVAHVEVSTNGGKDWSPATFDPGVPPYAWILWQYGWEARSPGTYSIMARARDDQGNTQPAARDPQRFDGYELNSYHSVRCEVR